MDKQLIETSPSDTVIKEAESRFEQVISLAEKLGVEAVPEGENRDITVRVSDGRNFDLLEIIEAHIDLMVKHD